MSPTKIDSVVQELKQEEDRIQNELAELKTCETELKKELKRVRADISGLDSKKRPASRSSKSAPKKPKKPKKPDPVEPSPEEVFEIDFA